MYAAVPRMHPGCVIAGVVMVATARAGAGPAMLQRLCQSEIQHLHRAVGRTLMLAGLRSR